MSRLPDEQWAMIEDSIDKKKIARSSHNRRSHCGKGGSVKFPSDYMSKKELKAMNSEVKSYRMNDPMSWSEFKQLPDDLKVTYIKNLREKYKVPNFALAKAMRVGATNFSKLMNKLGLDLGKGASSAGKKWQYSVYCDEFWNWWGVPEEKPTKSECCEGSPVDIHEVPAVIGHLEFNCSASEALDTVKTILGDTNVHIRIEWTI